MITEKKPRRQHRTAPRLDAAHWPKPWEFQVRHALNTEGEAIRDLVDQATKAFGWQYPACDWSRVAPFWYVADLQGWLLGAVQVCVGLPLSRIELLSVHQGLSQTKRAKVVKALLGRALHDLQVNGATLACGMIPMVDDEFVRIVERMGARYTTKGHLLCYPLVTHGGQHGV